uniref:Uncharacterized protein n=1 Tax=Meloidogyne javanica TaxID=6303 RepID=A0A915LC38_MELJA
MSSSRSEHFSLNTSQLSESNEDDNNRDVLERTEDDEDDSFHPELEEDELSTNARTLIEQIASASEAGCSTQTVSEELVDLQRLRRTQKIFKELQFNNPGRQLAESLSTDGLTDPVYLMVIRITEFIKVRLDNSNIILVNGGLCKKCGSQKCSYSCRNNRRTYIESIDELGSGSTKNPFL